MATTFNPPNPSKPSAATLQRLTSRWQALAPREQTLVAAALAFVAFAVLWWVLVAPALGVLKTASTQRAALDAQLQQMQTLQAQAKALQGKPKMNPGDAARALDASVKQRLGAAAQLSVAGAQATLTLKNVPADALAQWLTQARSAANAVPSQARLRISTSSPGAWDGTLVMSLPAQP